MAYKLLIAGADQWLKDLSALEKSRVADVLDQLAALQQEPWPLDVSAKRMQEEDLADFRFYFDKYRVLFDRDLAEQEVRLYRLLPRFLSYTK
jgi:hypothetical protein